MSSLLVARMRAAWPACGRATTGWSGWRVAPDAPGTTQTPLHLLCCGSVDRHQPIERGVRSRPATERKPPHSGTRRPPSGRCGPANDALLGSGPLVSGPDDDLGAAPRALRHGLPLPRIGQTGRAYAVAQWPDPVRSSRRGPPAGADEGRSVIAPKGLVKGVRMALVSACNEISALGREGLAVWGYGAAVAGWVTVGDGAATLRSITLRRTSY
jgi:hypothetical protein